MRLKQAQTQPLRMFIKGKGAKINMIQSITWTAAENTIQATLQSYTDTRTAGSYGEYEMRVKRLICDPDTKLAKGTGIGAVDATAPEYEIDTADEWPTHNAYLLKAVKV